MAAATGHRTLKERQRHEREQLILDAAEELLLEKGYHDTSVEEIAAQVGISKGAVYLHFASKEDLMFALLERGVRAVVCSLDTILATEDSPHAKLSAIITQLYGGASGRRYRLFSSVLQSPELISTLAERHRKMDGLWTEPFARIAALIEGGKRDGRFDPDIPTPVMLTLLGSLLTPQGYAQLVVRHGMAMDDVVRHLCRFYFKGIAPVGAHEAHCDM